MPQIHLPMSQMYAVTDALVEYKKTIVKNCSPAEMEKYGNELVQDVDDALNTIKKAAEEHLAEERAFDVLRKEIRALDTSRSSILNPQPEKT